MNGVRRGKGARTTVPAKDGRRAGICWTVTSPHRHPTSVGSRTSPTAGPGPVRLRRLRRRRVRPADRGLACRHHQSHRPGPDTTADRVVGPGPAKGSRSSRVSCCTTPMPGASTHPSGSPAPRTRSRSDRRSPRRDIITVAGDSVSDVQDHRCRTSCREDSTTRHARVPSATPAVPATRRESEPAGHHRHHHAGPVPGRSSTHLRPVPGLGQPTHGRVSGGGRGCLRTPLTTTQGRLTQGAARRGARPDPPTAQETR